MMTDALKLSDQGQKSELKQQQTIQVNINFSKRKKNQQIY